MIGFFNILALVGSEKVLENVSQGPGKVLDFVVSKRVETQYLAGLSQELRIFSLIRGIIGILVTDNLFIY